jgi:V8-like Glu-specific endopeptidase
VKYLAICKLFIYFKTLEKTKSISKEAIGWRYMDSKTIATAGYVVYDGINGQGIAIEAHIGYRGANSVLIWTHDSKMATFVAVHREWYNHFAKENDIPLIMLQTAFDEVLPLRFKDSPEKEERIKVCMAGYPEDIPTSSRGQFIRESKREIDFHLQSNKGMLHHQLDTFKGKLAPSVTSCLLTYLRQFWFSGFPDRGRSRARSHCNPYSVLQNPSTRFRP